MKKGSPCEGALEKVMEIWDKVQEASTIAPLDEIEDDTELEKNAIVIDED